LSKFLLTLSPQNLAGQIASLINAGGQLRLNLAVHHILRSQTEYIVELDGQKVIGVIGVHKVSPQATELRHLCVRPEYRGRGLGRKLLEKGIENTKTEIVYGLVRRDNKVNMRNNLRVGMIPVAKVQNRLIVFARRRNGYQNRVQRGSQGHQVRSC